MRAIPRLAFVAGAATAGLALGLPAASYAATGSAGNAGTVSGNQVQAPVRAPADVCGNGIGVLGTAQGGDCGDGYSGGQPSPTDCPSSGAHRPRAQGSGAQGSGAQGSGAQQHSGNGSLPGSRNGNCAGAPDPAPSSRSATPSRSSGHAVPVGGPSSDAGGPPEEAPILPVTGTSLTILSGSAITLLAGGIVVLVLARRRRT